jgi:hypothetical protein
LTDQDSAKKKQLTYFLIKILEIYSLTSAGDVTNKLVDSFSLIMAERIKPKRRQKSNLSIFCGKFRFKLLYAQKFLVKITQGLIRKD